MPNALSRESSLTGLLLGTAVGDSLCLPYEGLSARRAARRLRRLGARHSLCFGHGMLSDDTEHTAMVIEACMASGTDPALFERILARKLRHWFLALPPGIGMGTARACIKLSLGVSAARSGVPSAGNGPAMRSGAIGLLVPVEWRREFVERSSRVTHTDTRAVEGAWVIAECASFAASIPQDRLGEHVAEWLVPAIQSDGLRAPLALAVRAALDGVDPETFAASIDCQRGITGFVCHSVPAAVYIWLHAAGDFRVAMETTIRLGGDTDTVGAMAGGLVGAQVGIEGIPAEWIAGISDWPRSTTWLRSLALAAARGESRGPTLFWPAMLPRNLFLLTIVLAHGLRRIVPIPY